MRFVRITLAAALALGAGGILGTLALAGPGPSERMPLAAGDAGVSDEPPDMGVGERVLLVVGGVFDSRREADEANARLLFGELQGYYVAPVAQFRGLAGALDAAPGAFALVSAFRTEAGAREFEQLARAAGAPALVTGRLHNLGRRYVGLGQEAAPDGRGPLRGPLPGVTVP